MHPFQGPRTGLLLSWTKTPLRVGLALSVALSTFGVLASPAAGATVPNGFTDAQIASGFTRATAMTVAPDGRVFVAEQGGTLRVIDGGAVLSSPFLQLDVDHQGERGLLGVALDPGFPAEPYVYVYYTAKKPNVHNRVSRFTVSGDSALPTSERVLLDIDDLGAELIHNGGDMHFGADGKLYIAVGENATPANAQSLTTLKGKLLRINKDGSIPQDNPFYGTATGKSQAIWAVGLRNPFTFAIKPADGRIYINDVGQNAWEEINEGVAGANYGWPATEGYTEDPRYKTPLYAYGHGGAGVVGCAITGGAFYVPQTPAFPAGYVGDYFFADYCSGWIKRYNPSTDSVSDFAGSIPSPVDLEVTANGALLYLARGSGTLHRVTYTPDGPPTIVQHPRDQVVRSGEDATFRVVASGPQPLRYQWQRDGVDIVGATADAYTLSAASRGDDGAVFRVVVSNDFGSTATDPARLWVADGQRPTATISTPTVGTLYSAGNTITYSGSGSDTEDGDLTAGHFTWKVDFHHDDHTHPVLPPRTGSKTGSFTIPKTGETSTNVWFRIHLEVTDSSGLSHHVFRDVLPRISAITLDTSPGGLQLALDGSPVQAPFTTESVVGLGRWISTVSPQTALGRNYVFDSWSDGGTAAHRIPTPAAPKTYTAVYRPQSGSVGTGTGLSGTIFDTLNFGGKTVRRTDATVNFDWGTGRPAPTIGPETFSVRWLGQLQAQFGESYSLCVRSDNGARLWIDGIKVIDHWTSHTVTERCAIKSFAAGTIHSVRLDYYDNTGPAVAKLLWSSASTPKQVIPKSQLYP